jgi:hypothetical protein
MSGVNLIAKIDRFDNLETFTLYRLESITIFLNFPSIVPLFLLGKQFKAIGCYTVISIYNLLIN